uniref:Uncharacterized protein n=1 Tax=Ixodes ricinus TaxID=34613 RepID=A0A6B0U2T8_IXORI
MNIYQTHCLHCTVKCALIYRNCYSYEPHIHSFVEIVVNRPYAKLFKRLAAFSALPSLLHQDSSAVCQFRSVVGKNRGLLHTVIDPHPHLRAKG